MVDSSRRRSSRRVRVGLALAALALLPWGAAAFVLGTGATPAQALPQDHFEDHDLFMRVEKDGQTFFVRIDMFMLGAGNTPISEAEVEAARASYVARFPGAVALSDGEVGAQYVTSGFKWTANTVNWGYNNTGAKATVAGTAAPVVSASAASWNAAGSNFSFTGGGGSSAGTGACGGGTDGSNTVGWGAQSGSVLAVTCTWYSSAGGSGGYAAATEFDMEIDPDWNWTTGDAIQIDLQSVVTHEFGHALGLNHSASGAAVMYASYGSGSNKRALTGDDVSGLLAIYGAAGGGSPTNTPVPTNTPAATNTPTRTPTPVPPTNTPTRTPTPLPGATNTPVVPPTATPTTAAPTATPTTVAVPTATPTRPPTTPESASPTATRTATPVPPTAAPTAPAPTATPVATGTPESGLPVLPGNNLLTWPGNNAPPATALGKQGKSLKIVYEWDPVAGEWKRWSPNVPDFVNNLKMMKQGTSYWFISNIATQLPFGQ